MQLQKRLMLKRVKLWMPEGLRVALQLLSRREHSAKQLIEKLKQRGFADNTIDEVLNHCQQHGLQSDARFAEMLSRSRINRGYGPRVIRQLLQQAAVSAAVIDAQFDALASEIDWIDIVARVWHKKYRSNTDTSLKAIQKQRQFLYYRGFTETMIKAFFETRCDHEIDE